MICDRCLSEFSPKAEDAFHFQFRGARWPAEDEAKVRKVTPEQVEHERKYTNKND